MSYKITRENCKEWEKNKEANPITGKKIKIDGPVYKRFEKECATVSTGDKSKKEIVFYHFKNDALKKDLETDVLKITTGVNNKTILIIVEDDQILLDQTDPILEIAEKQKLPLVSANTLKDYLRYNKRANLEDFIQYLKDEQYPTKRMDNLTSEFAKLMLQK